MKIMENNPPRKFECGFDVKRQISDCAKIELENDEQVTFTTADGGEYDVARKDFGFYATPSTNARLKRFGLRAVLAQNRLSQFFVLLVEKGKERLFENYMEEEKMSIVMWLDDPERLAALVNQKAG